MLQQGKNTQRSGRDETRQTYSHATYIDGMKTVHILAIINGHDDFLLVNMGRKRQLHDEAIYIFILVQLVHTGQQLFLGHVVLVANKGRLESTLLTGKHLILDIGLAASVMSYEYSSQVWLFSSVGNNLCHLFGYLLLNGICRSLPVYQLHFIQY